MAQRELVTHMTPEPWCRGRTLAPWAGTQVPGVDTRPPREQAATSYHNSSSQRC
jgi:hypothetical protein